MIFGGYFGQYALGPAATPAAPEEAPPTAHRPGMGGHRRPITKRQREIEQQIDELVDGLLAEPKTTPTVVPAAKAQPQPAKRKPIPPLPGPIHAPEPIPVGPAPQPEPWLLSVPAIETADDTLRLLLSAAALTL